MSDLKKSERLDLTTTLIVDEDAWLALCDIASFYLTGHAHDDSDAETVAFAERIVGVLGD